MQFGNYLIKTAGGALIKTAGGALLLAAHGALTKPAGAALLKAAGGTWLKAAGGALSKKVTGAYQQACGLYQHPAGTYQQAAARIIPTGLALVRLIPGRLLTSAGLLWLLAACSASTITLQGEYPEPLVSKIPITVGVYYPEELRNFSYIEIDDNTGKDQYIINSGASQIELFNTVLPALFQHVVLLDDLESVAQNTNLNAVFVPAIEEFQLGLPSKTKLNVFEIWLKYNMRLSKPNGDFIADWVMTAYGKSPDESFQSVDRGIQDASVVAMRDLAARFVLEFAGEPGVNDWLKENRYLP